MNVNILWRQSSVNIYQECIQYSCGFCCSWQENTLAQFVNLRLSVFIRAIIISPYTVQ